MISACVVKEFGGADGPWIRPWIRSGTWPSSAFIWLASPIDHIFASGRARMFDVEVIELRRSDRKALAAPVELG